MIIWFIGISGAGKTTLGKLLYKKLNKKIKNLLYIDGDEFRSLTGNNIGYSLKDRNTNAKRLINFIKYISDQKINIICAANLTSKKYQSIARKMFKKKYFEIFVQTSIETLISERDYKQIYKKALQKKIKNVVGIDIKYSLPKNSNLIINNNRKKSDFSDVINKIISKSKIMKRKV